MLAHSVQRLCACSLIAGTGLFAAPAQLPGELTTDQIVQRALTRAQSVQEWKHHTNYAYQKITVVEELDDKGRVKTSKEKLLQFESGVSTLKELKKDGKLVALPVKREAEAEATADRQHVTRGPRTRRDDNWSEYLNKELTARYTFELVGREDVAGRPAYVLTFQPKNDKLPVKQITDRLLNRLGGKVWVDTGEFEVARAEINLLDEVTMWGGVLGAMKKFSFDVERVRVDDVWFNRVSNFELEGRKLLDGTRMRVKSEASNFRKSALLNN
jgi:hypothetical protein